MSFQIPRSREKRHGRYNGRFRVRVSTLWAFRKRYHLEWADSSRVPTKGIQEIQTQKAGRFQLACPCWRHADREKPGIFYKNPQPKLSFLPADCMTSVASCVSFSLNITTESPFLSILFFPYST